MTLHGDALRQLSAWSAPTPEQERLRQLFLAQLMASDDAVYRHLHPDHLTASTVVFRDDLTHVLLTLHRKLGRWLQTGGHCEPEDTHLSSAALREAREESGIDELVIDEVPVLLSRHEVPCGPQRPAHHLDVQYATTARSDAAAVLSEESLDLRWFAIDALPNGTDSSVRDLVSAGVSRLRENRAHARSSGNG